MDSIRPIGPVERDVEPIVRVTRAQPDARREGRDREEQPPPREPREPRSEPQPDPEEGEGGSLIDVRV